MNGSAPNLVVVTQDEQGNSYYKHAFNTQVSKLSCIQDSIIYSLYQACEQLNAWLGGFESIMKRMTGENFDWFIHVMLFYHTQRVLKRQATRNS